MKQGGAHIEQLSLGVYDSVRRLLGRLRPRQLDDLSLEQAVRSLMREMELESRGIVSHLDWRIDESLLSEGQRVTLFRVCQEGLNNIVKHANASAVTLQGWQQDESLRLVIEDDGCGLPPGSGQQGFGGGHARAREGAGRHAEYLLHPRDARQGQPAAKEPSCLKPRKRRADRQQSGDRRPLPLLASSYPDHYLARLRVVLLYPQKFQRRRAKSLPAA